MRRIMVLGPWVWGGWSSPKYFSPPGSLPDPSPVILSTAVFDCRTFQLNKGKHQCFAKGLKKKKKNPWKLLSQHPQQACCGYSSHCATSLCSRLSPSQPPVTASQPLRTFIPGQGPPITGHPLHFNIHLVCPALNKDQIKYNFFNQMYLASNLIPTMSVKFPTQTIYTKRNGSIQEINRLPRWLSSEKSMCQCRRPDLH